MQGGTKDWFSQVRENVRWKTKPNWKIKKLFCCALIIKNYNNGVDSYEDINGKVGLFPIFRASKLKGL